PLQDSADTDDSIPLAALSAEPAARRTPLVIASVVGVLLLGSVAMYATRKGPVETALQRPPTPELAAPAAPPIVPATVMAPAPETAVSATAPETTPPKTTRAVVRKEPVAAPLPVATPVEAEPTET